MTKSHRTFKLSAAGRAELADHELRQQNWPVTALIAFRYDGPESWAVELGQP